MLFKSIRNIFLFVLVVLFVSPIFSLISVIFTEGRRLEWLSNLLPGYTLNTIILIIGVGFISFVVGVLSSWFIAYYSFPGKRFFEIALFLPLSIPGYIVSYVYVNIFEFSGPIQSFLREMFNWTKGDYYFPDVRSLGWGIIIMGFNLYPYVYMLVRTGFITIRSTVAVAITLGRSPFKVLFSVAMSAIRPSIVAGLSLVMMEVVADFGTPQFLAIDTFTTGIYRNWFLLHDKYSAVVLAFIELLFVFSLIFIEKFSCHKEKSYSVIKMNTGYYCNWKIKSKKMMMFIYSVCLLPIFIGFVVPIIPLIYWTFERLNVFVGNSRFHDAVINSVSISLVTSFISVMISLTMAYIVRGRRFFSYIVNFVTMGYAIPNMVTALSIIILFSAVSQLLNLYFSNVMLIGTILGLLYSYTFRFLAVSMGPIESGLNKIPREVDWSSSLMGHGSIFTCLNVHVPLIKKSIIVAFLLVFVDTIKELSATLIIRPFNFETMATQTYELVSDERYMDAAPYAMVIVLIGLISVVVLSSAMKCNCDKLNSK